MGDDVFQTIRLDSAARYCPGALSAPCVADKWCERENNPRPTRRAPFSSDKCPRMAANCKQPPRTPDVITPGKSSRGASKTAAGRKQSIGLQLFGIETAAPKTLHFSTHLPSTREAVQTDVSPSHSVISRHAEKGLACKGGIH